MQENIEPALLQTARDAYEQARYGQVLALLRPWPREGAEAIARCELETLHGVSAFRVGELAEALSRAAVLLADPAAHADASRSWRFDMLAVDVVAAGELLQYERSLSGLRELLSLAGRLGGLVPWVRARGSVSICFALLGDLEASRRVMAELAGVFQGHDLELRLEAAVRGNLASVSLMLARQAQAANEVDAVTVALEDAVGCVTRCDEIAGRLGDQRLAAFARVHEAECGMLRAAHPESLAPLQAAAESAARAGLSGHVRQLQLLRAECQLACGQPDEALALLTPLTAELGEGHEFGSRVRLHTLLADAHRARGDLAAAWLERERADRLQALRHLRQAQAQSRFVRQRLELEYLFNRRAGPG
jgi:hypothetical protein